MTASTEIGWSIIYSGNVKNATVKLLVWYDWACVRGTMVSNPNEESPPDYI